VIYSTPSNLMTWQGVQDFLGQGVREGAYVDYKVDWPNNLERTIAAMANTLGGLIFIGVDENTDGTPKIPAVGIELTRGLSERVTNIVLSNITPPVFPDVAVCSDSAGQRAIVVIRVSQSHHAPHAIMGDRRVYVRTANTNNPEDLATQSELEWLREHRTKAVALRDTGYRSAIDRSDIALGYLYHSPTAPGTRVLVPEVKPYLLLCVAPYYPREPFLMPPMLRELTRGIRIKDYYGTDNEFPIGANKARLLQNGVYWIATLDGEHGQRDYYTEFNVFGQFFYRQTLTYQNEGEQFIRASELFARLDQFMRIAHTFLERIGYQGSVWFQLLMGSLTHSTLGHWSPSERIEQKSKCLDEAIAFEGALTMNEWDAQSEATLIDTARKIGWGYDWDFGAELVQAYWAKHRRL
jgi:hypothetical protein